MKVELSLSEPHKNRNTTCVAPHSLLCLRSLTISDAQSEGEAAYRWARAKARGLPGGFSHQWEWRARSDMGTLKRAARRGKPRPRLPIALEASEGFASPRLAVACDHLLVVWPRRARASTPQTVARRDCYYCCLACPRPWPPPCYWLASRALPLWRRPEAQLRQPPRFGELLATPRTEGRQTASRETR